MSDEEKNEKSDIEILDEEMVNLASRLVDVNDLIGKVAHRSGLSRARVACAILPGMSPGDRSNPHHRITNWWIDQRGKVAESMEKAGKRRARETKAERIKSLCDEKGLTEEDLKLLRGK